MEKSREMEIKLNMAYRAVRDNDFSTRKPGDKEAFISACISEFADICEIHGRVFYPKE